MSHTPAWCETLAVVPTTEVQMPSGYTAALHDGEQSFEAFAWGVARGFGALISMREDPAGAEIPVVFEPSAYHREAADRARSELRRYETMSAAALAEEQAAKRDEAVRYREAYVAERDARLARYEAMLVRARAFVPPSSEHEHFKEEMVKQLEESIRFDCGDYEPSIPLLELAREYRARKLEKAQHDVGYHEAEYAKDVTRARERSEWVNALRGALAAVAA